VCETPSHDAVLAGAILATVKALDVATVRAGLSERDARHLAADTFTTLCEAAKTQRRPGTPKPVPPKYER
jgi:hypothetical protein